MILSVDDLSPYTKNYIFNEKFFFLIYIAIKFINFTFQTTAGLYNFFQKYWIYYIITILIYIVHIIVTYYIIQHFFLLIYFFFKLKINIICFLGCNIIIYDNLISQFNYFLEEDIKLWHTSSLFFFSIIFLTY